MYDFKDKVVVVTGGSNGIGETTVREFAKANATVILNYYSDSTKAKQIVDDMKKDGKIVVLKQGSVDDESFIKEMFLEVSKEFGKIDILINNAGITKDEFLMISKVEDINKVIDTNLKGVILCSKYVTPYMISNRRGKIINMSSVAAFSGNAAQTIYSATKAGIIGFTKSLAKELARYNIHVNTIAPGFITTNMTSKLPKKMLEKYIESIPLHKFGEPRDISQLIQFLCSEECNYIIGQVLTIDGGLTC